MFLIVPATHVIVFVFQVMSAQADSNSTPAPAAFQSAQASIRSQEPPTFKHQPSAPQLEQAAFPEEQMQVLFDEPHDQVRRSFQ